MKFKYIFQISILLIFTFSCRSDYKKSHITNYKDSISESRTERIAKYKIIIDSLNISLQWQKTNFDLWKSKNGDLGIKTTEGNEEGIFIDKYIIHLANGIPLNEVIDTLTFKYLGSSFYGDKNHIYTHYKTVDGGNFWIVDEADVKTFRIIGSCYAKDKNYIFGERAMKMDSVDYRTFKTCKDCGCFAKDKNGFYFWNSKIDLNDIEYKETKKIIEKLKKV